ncbi:MAG: PDZ domain-containing protein [Phycisphaerales bacterium]|nr:PDZ domain-containing protein [Phycisphaerales bacterium]
MKTSLFILLGATIMSTCFWGCNTLTTSSTTSIAPTQATANKSDAPNAEQSTEGPRPAFLTPRSDGTYVDIKGNVLVPPTVMLGLTMEQPGPALCKHLNINPARTTLLVDIIPGLPGDKGGVVDHDIVIAVDGSPNASANDIRNKLKKMKPGETITFMLQRGSEKKSVTLTTVPWIAEHMVRPLHAGSFTPPGLSSDAERDVAPRELMPVIDRLNHIEQQLNEIQVELKKAKKGG